MASRDTLRSGTVYAQSTTKGEVETKAGPSGRRVGSVNGTWDADGLTLTNLPGRPFEDRVQREMHDPALLAGRLRGSASRHDRTSARMRDDAARQHEADLASLHALLAAVYELPGRTHRTVALNTVQAGFTGTREQLLSIVAAAHLPATT